MALTDGGAGDLGSEHVALLHEARPGIERLLARSPSAAENVVFLIAEVESSLGQVILGLGVPRHPSRRSVVIPLTRDDAVRAAGPLMGPSLTAKLDAHAGAAALVMAAGSARVVALSK